MREKEREEENEKGRGWKVLVDVRACRNVDHVYVDMIDANR